MNLEEEVRFGFKITKERKKVWAVQLELFKALMCVCEKYNLKIWAGSGTLIGAIRDHGFIPWDDDMDLGMFREDYDRLFAVADKEFQSPLYFQTVYKEKDYSHGHAQLRMDGTAEILPLDVNQDFHQGIFIDIFVLDAVPDNEDEYLNLKAKATRMKNLMDQYCYTSFSLKRPWSFLTMLYAKHLINKIGIHEYYRQYENLFKKNKISENRRVSYLSFRFNEKKIFDKRFYDEILFLPFEDLLMPVPCGYDTILRAEYGDYMVRKNPPSTHGDVIVFDTEHSYLDFLPELREEYKRTRWKRFYKKIHEKLLGRVLKAD